jgi:hypothetical protein
MLQDLAQEVQWNIEEFQFGVKAIHSISSHDVNVRGISLDEAAPVTDNQQQLLELVLLEGEALVVACTMSGYQVVGVDRMMINLAFQTEPVYETLQALLGARSPM